MNKHTPGPWGAVCRDITYQGGEWPEDEFLQWEVVGPRIPNGRGDYIQADARLIAAAPELLEALRECADRLAIHMKHTEDLIAHMQAHKAIAKATGEA